MRSEGKTSEKVQSQTDVIGYGGLALFIGCNSYPDRVPIWTEKPGKMGRHFSVREF